MEKFCRVFSHLSTLPPLGYAQERQTNLTFRQRASEFVCERLNGSFSGERLLLLLFGLSDHASRS